MGAPGPARVPEPGSQARYNPRRDKLLRRFADHLEGIWLAAGKPSYRDLEKLDPQLSKSTISDVLRGKTAPSDRFVCGFVRVCHQYVRQNGHYGHHAYGTVFDERAVFEAWCQLQRDLRQLRRRRPRAIPAPAHRPPEEPVLHRSSAACSAGCAAANAEVVALRRVIDALRRMNTA